MWIPPGLVHAVAMVEEADLVSIYVLQDDPAQGPVLPDLPSCGVACNPQDWARCRVLEVSPLMRELITALPKQSDDQPAPDAATLQREHHLSALLLEELRRASEVHLGVNMPQDKRLRMLCEAVVADPTQHESLADWAADTGASPRTVARLFQQQLGCSFTTWRQQVVLAHGLSSRARPAHTADRRRAGLQPQRLQRHGAPHGGHASGTVLRAAGRLRCPQGRNRRCIAADQGMTGNHRLFAIADPI